MSGAKFKEIEFKFYANDIAFSKFVEFCEERKPLSKKNTSGYDHFYTNPKAPGTFYRHRVGADMNQLSFKQQTSETDNFIRDEDNLDLNKNTNGEQISVHVGRHGYQYSHSIFKNCFIYKYDFYILVYYIAYDSQMNEAVRVVEIEMREDYPWNTEQEAWNSLRDMERLCRPLGITPQARVKKNLCELTAPR